MKSWLDIINLIECFFYSINYLPYKCSKQDFPLQLYENSVESQCESVLNPIFDTILRQNELGNPLLEEEMRRLSFFLS